MPLGFRAVPVANIPFPPMEAQLVRELPEGDGWQYEPKWDGFRGVLENAGGELALWSRKERPLLRYFPELRPLGDLLPPRLGARRRDRDRAGRCARLRRDADAAPSGRVADPEALGGDPGRLRRLRRAGLGRRAGVGAAARGAASAGRGAVAGFRISPATRDIGDARGVDGAVRGARPRRRDREAARRRRTCRARATPSSRSRSIERRTAWSSASAGRATARRSRRCCSVSTARTAASTTSARARSARRCATTSRRACCRSLDESPDRRFSEPNRWGTGELEQTSLRRGLVVEVRYDKVQGNRFRHGTKFIRWREDKDPRDCTWREVRPPRDPNALGIEQLLGD